MFNVNLVLPQWHDPFHVSSNCLESASEVMMGK